MSFTDKFKNRKATDGGAVAEELFSQAIEAHAKWGLGAGLTREVALAQIMFAAGQTMAAAALATVAPGEGLKADGSRKHGAGMAFLTQAVGEYAVQCAAAVARSYGPSAGITVVDLGNMLRAGVDAFGDPWEDEGYRRLARRALVYMAAQMVVLDDPEIVKACGGNGKTTPGNEGVREKASGAVQELQEGIAELIRRAMRTAVGLPNGEIPVAAVPKSG